MLTRSSILAGSEPMLKDTLAEFCSKSSGCTCVCICGPTMGEAVQPVVAQIHSQEGEPPGPGWVPGQLQQPVVVPHINVCGQFDAPHEHPGQS